MIQGWEGLGRRPWSLALTQKFVSPRFGVLHGLLEIEVRAEVSSWWAAAQRLEEGRRDVERLRWLGICRGVRMGFSRTLSWCHQISTGLGSDARRHTRSTRATWHRRFSVCGFQRVGCPGCSSASTTYTSVKHLQLVEATELSRKAEEARTRQTTKKITFLERGN